jgi:two-component system, sensor histidine kinase
MSTEEAERHAADSQQVFAEQVRLVYQLGMVGAFAVLVVACLYALVVWAEVPRLELIGWVVAITLVSVVRIALAYVRKRRAIQNHVRAWGWGLIALATLTGLSWAYAGTALFPYSSSTQMQLIAVIMLVGMPAGAVASFGPYVKSYACYLVSSMAPFAIGLYLRGGDVAGWVLFASLVFTVYLLRVALWLEKTLSDNITQRLELQRMARELAHARDVAEAADRAKSSLLANISQEVRNPLNAMRDMNEQLLVTPLNAEQRDKVQTVQQASISLLDMLDTALDLSRIEAGPLDVHEARFDPHAIVARIEHMYQPLAQRKQLAFGLTIAPEVPHALLGDPVRWLQVLSILLDNALKFTWHGTVSVAVEASVNRGVCVLRAEVTDTGIGLTPDERFNLFKRLTQMNGAAAFDASKGGCLGIACDLAKLMGGDIGVTSEKGKGCRFWFNARMRIADPKSS